MSIFSQLKELLKNNNIGYFEEGSNTVSINIDTPNLLKFSTPQISSFFEKNKGSIILDGSLKIDSRNKRTVQYCKISLKQ